MKKIVALITVCIIGITGVSFTACARQASGAVVLENQFISRVLEYTNNSWRTVAIKEKTCGTTIPVKSDEFLIRLMDGTELTAADYRTVTLQPQVTDDPSTPGRKQCEIVYTPGPDTPSDAPGIVIARYYIDTGEPYVRKTVTLETESRQPIDRLEVERLRTSLPSRQGGKGEPVFVGDHCFLGLEYPASDTSHKNDIITLAHYPGYSKQFPGDEAWQVRSKTAVTGIAPTNIPIRLFFSDYIERVRIPIRNVIHYNSWYDLRGKEITPERLLAIFDGFKTNLLDPYGIVMDTFVPDDGYQERNSLWEPRKSDYPDGFVTLGRELEKRGSRLGLWLPLNGYYLNIAWGVSQGFEQAEFQGKKKAYYDLAGSNYNVAIRKALKRVITQGNVAYMKHDFNFLQSDTGDAYPHTARHGHEANVDAQLDLLAFQRDVKTDIFLNVTSCLWHSPWWLMHADSIWMCAGDSDFDHSFPQFSAREWATTYRDKHLYQVCVKQGHLVPISAYMTHGIVLGRYHSEGFDDETVREWSDYVMMYYGRGVQLKELYISPDIVRPDLWPALGETTRWAVHNTSTLERVVMIGGDPHKAEPYGYMHWKDDRGILVVRNPNLGADTISVPFDQGAGYRGPVSRPFKARAVYPFVEPMNWKLTAGRVFDVSIPGASVMVYEIIPGTAPDTPLLKAQQIQNVKAEFIQKDNAIHLKIPVPDEDMLECALRLIIKGELFNPKMPVVTVNGKPAGVRASNGPDWSMRSIDLLLARGTDADVVISFQKGANALFMKPLDVSVWLVADRHVTAPPPPKDEIFPYLVSQNYRRQTRELLPETHITPPPVRTKVSDKELQNARAAMLRVMVFGAEVDNNTIGLNGSYLVNLPKNEGVNDSWEEKTIPLTPAQMKRLGRSNTFQIKNGGDYFKVKGLSLVLQLQDGSWVRSSIEEIPHSSIRSWAHAEGKSFVKNKKSEEITLVFE
jgi:hypothetical protein